MHVGRKYYTKASFNTTKDLQSKTPHTSSEENNLSKWSQLQVQVALLARSLS